MQPVTVYYQRPCFSATMQLYCILKLLLPTHYQGLKRVTYWSINIPYRSCLQELPEHQVIDSALFLVSSCYRAGNVACLAAVGSSFCVRGRTFIDEEEKHKCNAGVAWAWLSLSILGSSAQCPAWHDCQQQQRATSLPRHAVSGRQPDMAA